VKKSRGTIEVSAVIPFVRLPLSLSLSVCLSVRDGSSKRYSCAPSSRVVCCAFICFLRRMGYGKPRQWCQRRHSMRYSPFPFSPSLSHLLLRPTLVLTRHVFFLLRSRVYAWCWPG
jgi:hypothetical protein